MKNPLKIITSIRMSVPMPFASASVRAREEQNAKRLAPVSIMSTTLRMKIPNFSGSAWKPAIQYATVPPAAESRM